MPRATPASRSGRDLGAGEVDDEITGQEEGVRPGQIVLVGDAVAVDVAARRAELGDDVAQLHVDRDGLAAERVEADADSSADLGASDAADVRIGAGPVHRRALI